MKKSTNSHTTPQETALIEYLLIKNKKRNNNDGGDDGNAGMELLCTYSYSSPYPDKYKWLMEAPLEKDTNELIEEHYPGIPYDDIPDIEELEPYILAREKAQAQWNARIYLSQKNASVDPASSITLTNLPETTNDTKQTDGPDL